MTKLISPEKRASVIGIGTAIAFAVQCMLQLFGGVLADIRWNYVFLVHLLILIPLVIQTIHLSKMELDVTEHRSSSHSRLPLTAILLSSVMGLVGLNIAPLLFGSAFYVSAINDSSTVAAVIAMMFSIGCMVGGFIFPFFYRKLYRTALSVFLFTSAAGILMSAFTNRIAVLGLGFFIGGVSNACIMACIMAILGVVCNRDQIAFASSMMMALMNLGPFLCSGWESLLGMLTGDALYTPLYIGAATFVSLGVIMLIRPPLPKSKA